MFSIMHASFCVKISANLQFRNRASFDAVLSGGKFLLSHALHAGKRKAKSKSRQQNIHFNDTFEEGQEDSSPQLDSSEEQLQPTKAGGKWVTLPRVLEELPETATSNRATTAAVENAISEKIPDSSQEAQVQLGNREVCSQEIVPADEEVPAKVIVEFEEYQPQLPPAAQKKLVRIRCMELPF